MSASDLSQYEDEVITVPALAKKTEITWYVPCGNESLSLLPVTEFSHKLYTVELRQTVCGLRLQNGEIIPMAYVWMGKCPYCGRVYQTWLPSDNAYIDELWSYAL